MLLSAMALSRKVRTLGSDLTDVRFVCTMLLCLIGRIS